MNSSVAYIYGFLPRLVLGEMSDAMMESTYQITLFMPRK